MDTGPRIKCVDTFTKERLLLDRFTENPQMFSAGEFVRHQHDTVFVCLRADVTRMQTVYLMDNVEH